MKKFKLIKQYPGSVELGAIRSDCGTPMLQKYFINYPEFWKEVTDKEFEILSFKQDSGIKDLWRYFQGRGWCRDHNGSPETGPYTTEAILNNKLYNIHSVMRISDGEVFTVGDRAKTITSKGRHTVTQLRVRQKCTGRDGKGGYNYDGIDRIWIDWEDDCGGNWLESTEKIKQPIFLTHDGKDIFEGDKIWYVNKENFYYDYILACSEVKFYSNIRAYFLTRVEAEDYIEKNKPLFTTEDGVDIKEGDTYYFVDTDFSIQTVKALRGAGQYSERKYFSTVEEAHEYVMQNVKALSIKDFWEITCMSTSNFNKSTYMRDLVKKTLGLK